MSEDYSNSGTRKSRTKQDDQEVQYNNYSTTYACVYRSQGECLKANTALGFASCCISLLTHPLVLYFSYTRGST